MLKCLFILLLIFIKVKNLYDVNENTTQSNNNITVKPGTAETILINYQEESFFNFENTENAGESELQINIHSINCNIEIDVNPLIQNITNINLNIYSIIASDKSTISIKPIKDIIDGRIKENYQAKNCPIIINSYYIEVQKRELEIKNKEENVFYFNKTINSLKISYEIKNISKNSFVSLYFKFKEAPFSINIFYDNTNNQSNSLSKIITESTYIYLNSEFLMNNNDNTNVNGSLSIIIKYENNIPIYMFLKIIEENTVCLLEENALNFGFITSKTTYQYYYKEVLDGEEGELMLHNKRQYGILHAIIKNKTNITSINNICEYPIGNNPEEELEYDQHYLQLKINYKNTSNCTNGCYLLITYEQIKSKEGFPRVGYEFTILSRTWNHVDYISSIIDIPYNEYIISCFDKLSSREHYYSIYIPDEAENIIIQLEGDYFDAFYDKGRKKVNTLDGEANKLEAKDIQNVIIFNSDDIVKFKSQGKSLSFSFRPKDYLTNIISSYYFRVLYKKENEVNYLPMDSNLGNLCLPEKDSFSEYYYCNLKLKNDYDESNMNFSISSTNPNEYVKINLTGIFNNELLFNITDYFNLVYDKNKSYVDYFLIEFKFKNDEIKTIISSFCDEVNETYPQIYSAQMFYLNNFNKTHQFKLKNSFLGHYQFIGGASGIPNKSYSFPNFKRKLISFHIKKNSNINISTVTHEFIYSLQLIHNIKNEEILELKQGKPLVEFTDKNYFPFYYYYKLNNDEYINVNINFKIYDHSKSEIKNYTVKGYIIDEDKINRKLNGEYIEIPTPFEGKYSDAYGIGFLQVNQNLTGNDSNGTHYLFITLDHNIKQKEPKSSLFYVEIMAKEYDNNNGLFLPQNEYFLDSFDDAENGIREVNQYSIFNPEGNKIQPVIELSSEYRDIKLNFTNNIDYKIENSTGFQRFSINEDINETIYFNVINSGKKANYMIIYYLSDTYKDNTFSLDTNYKLFDHGDNSQGITNISLHFNGLSVESDEDDDINFYITGTLYERNPNSLETINNTCFLQERKEAFVNKTFSVYNKTNDTSSNWTLVFRNIPRNGNLFYDLRIQIIANIMNDNSKEEFMAFGKEVNLIEIKQIVEKPKEGIPWYAWGIPVIVVGVILVVIILGFFILKFLKLKKKNTTLQQEMDTLAFSNDIQKNVLMKDMELSKSESDYESTFI